MASSPCLTTGITYEKAARGLGGSLSVSVSWYVFLPGLYLRLPNPKLVLDNQDHNKDDQEKGQGVCTHRFSDISPNYMHILDYVKRQSDV
jgi:hypothetical protein